MQDELCVDTLSAGDNYIHLIRSGEHLTVVDPGTARPVLEYIEQTGLKLDKILITHCHYDHTGGCDELEKISGGRIIGPADSAQVAAKDGDLVKACGCEFTTFATPGHTHEHLCFYSAAAKILFTGDTLFYCGCGRVFTGDYQAMWSSLERLRKLPGDTRVYCGHDYTSDNIEFALSVDPENQRLFQRARRPIFSSIETETATNPFLRTENESIRGNIGLPYASPPEVFSKLRKLKDAF